MYFLFYSKVCFRCFQDLKFLAWSCLCDLFPGAVFRDNCLSFSQLSLTRMFANCLVEFDGFFWCLWLLASSLWLTPAKSRLWSNHSVASCTWPCEIPDFSLLVFLVHSQLFSILLETSESDLVHELCRCAPAVLFDIAISSSTFLRYLISFAWFGLLFFWCHLFSSSFFFLLFLTLLFYFSVWYYHSLLSVGLFCFLEGHIIQHLAIELKIKGRNK